MGNDPGEEKREKIFSATLKLIAEKGFHGTAMSKVAREAGVSAGIIYHYFENKDELIIELYKELKRQMADSLVRNFDQTQPLTAQVRYICGECFRYHLKHPRQALFFQQFATSPYYTTRIEKEMRCHFGVISETFERGMQEMIIKDLPGPVIETLLIDVASSLAKKHAVGLVELTDALVDRVMDALWEAIRN
ncbi:MAG: TetR/AcrR family transcriptional regulator [Desulfobacter sp.]